MPYRSLAPNSLARRFAVVAAALATAALLFITVSSWWMVDRQHEEAIRELDRKEADFHAATVGRTLHALALRMAEVANSTILATGLVDSAGKETYLTPYLASIRQVNGIPIEILFADFEGKEVSRNGPVNFSDEQIDWLRQRLESGRQGAAVFPGAEGQELVAAEMLNYARTPTPEGAVLYKIKLADLLPAPQARLSLGKPPAVPEGTYAVPVATPLIFDELGLHLVTRPEPMMPASPVPQYLVILVIAVALAAAVYLIGLRLALSLTADLRRLEAFSSSVIRQGFSHERIEERGSAEVAGLARSINHMLDRLYEQHTLLQDETHKLHQLASTIPQLAWIAHPDGTIHWYNERWYAYTGSVPGQDGGTLWEHMRPDAAAKLRAAIAAGQAFQMTLPLRGADGVERPFFTSAAPLRASGGEIVQWFGTNTDVSPLERAERAVRESEERLREGLGAARMAVWDWDLDSGRIEYAANASDVFGVELQGRPAAWDAVHPDDRPGLRAAVQQALEARTSYEKVVRMRHASDGEYRWVDVRGRVLCDEQGRPHAVRGISLDITSRKRAEDALVAANRRKDDFLAMLAHELRNPLAPISTAAQILQRIPVETRVRELSEIIARQVEHMNKLVDDLLDVSRVTRGLVKLDREAVCVDDIVSGAVEQVRTLIELRRHRLTLEPQDGGAWVLADRTRLVQVVANLLNNAAKYTPDGGHILLRAEADEGEVRIRVRDNGIGIASDLLPHVFELFIQADRSPDRSQGGLGLGLTLVRSLTELHGGSVSATSEGTGRGSEFVIRMPRLAVTPEQGTLAQPAIPAAQAGRAARIMVVDDNADAALSLAILLESIGYSVGVEYDARRALERAKAEAPNVLLLDIGLPDMDGYQLARRLRAQENTRHALLIAVTGYGQEEDRERSRNAGFDHHLVKPVDTKSLVQLLERHANG